MTCPPGFEVADVDIVDPAERVRADPFPEPELPTVTLISPLDPATEFPVVTLTCPLGVAAAEASPVVIVRDPETPPMPALEEAREIEPEVVCAEYPDRRLWERRR